MRIDISQLTDTFPSFRSNFFARFCGGRVSVTIADRGEPAKDVVGT